MTCPLSSISRQWVFLGRAGWLPFEVEAQQHFGHSSVSFGLFNLSERSHTSELFKHTTSDETPSADRKILYLAISSDSGLCGGIHSGISRYVRKAQASEPGSIVIVGDKSKAQLSRALPQALQVTFNGVGKDVPTFAEASAIADEIVKDGGSWDEVGGFSNCVRCVVRVVISRGCEVSQLDLARSVT